MNAVITWYKQHTGRDCTGTDCADCTNATWRIMERDADAEKYDAEAVGGKYSLVGRCNHLNTAITEHVYFCSDHTVSNADQKAEFRRGAVLPSSCADIIHKPRQQRPVR